MGPLLQSVGGEGWSPGRSEKRHSLDPVVSRQPRSSSVLSLEKMVTFFSKYNAAPVVAEGPYPYQVVVEVGHHITGGDSKW